MSAPRYERVDNGDDPPLFQAGEPSGQPPPYVQPATHPGPPQQYAQPPSQQIFSRTVVVQQPQTTVVMTRAPSDYMAWSILGCLFCLWPVGLCAIFASLDSRSKADSGDYEGAKTSGRRALGINTANTILGAILITVLIIFMT